MSRLTKIQEGQCGNEDYIYYINERHSVWKKRFVEKLSKPWTEDQIFQTYKFTNVFRQLDRGTIALRELLKGQTDPVLILFNIIWYRYFNLDVHTEELGFVEDYQQLEEFITGKARKGKQVFTGAWMTTGVWCEDKYITYLRACAEAWDKREELCENIQAITTMEEACTYLRSLCLVGKFLAYELACDLRFTILLNDATDKISWSNMGPGAQRGLRRLGYPHKNQSEGCLSMRTLYLEVELDDNIDSDILFSTSTGWPFELREIEHNLCEFDKYIRVKNGEGSPRSKYPGI